MWINCQMRLLIAKLLVEHPMLIGAYPLVLSHFCNTVHLGYIESS